jgi:hypothetical protein
MDPIVTQIVAGVDAFRLEHPAAQWARAAQLLVIAEQLGRPASSMSAIGREPVDPEIALLETPYVRPLATGDETNYRLAAVTSTGAGLWELLSGTASPSAAVALLVNQLTSPFEIVRVAAASALLRVPEERRLGYEALVAETQLRMPTPRALRSLALGTLGGPATETPAPRETDGVSVGIPGTFSRWHDTQLRQGTDIYRYLGRKLAPTLYADGKSAYRWTGQHSADARHDGSAALRQWLASTGNGYFDSIFTHSHGGNVALSAAADGTPIGFLLLIDTPALRRPIHEWAGINSRIGQAISLRSRLDLFVLLDAALSGTEPGDHSDGLNFDGAFTHTLLTPPLYFSHFALMQQKTWDRFEIIDQIRHQQSLVTRPTL